MARLIPDTRIQEVRERVDVIALVGRHGVELKKSGRSYKGLCPFHEEKSPSFYVWADEKRFKCFGCQASGDAISFVQRLTGKSFVEAVRELADGVGVDLESSDDGATREIQQLREATDLAASHFLERLWNPAAGRPARDYLQGRGVSEELARAWGLGWAPLAWTELADSLRARGLLSAGEKVGLCSPRAKGEGHYDVFRGRIVIPIRAAAGRTLGFGGRLLEGDGPKYINSKESELFRKSDVLFGADQARAEIRKRKVVVLCEGYFDAIAMHHVGMKNAVALCSTALTTGQLDSLRLLGAEELVLLLDGDEPGRQAVERLAGPLLASGLSARVAMLPEGEDPDTHARRVGAEQVLHLVNTARALSAHLFATLLPNGEHAQFEEKMSAVRRLRPVVAQVPPGLTRSALFAAMSKHFGLPAAELERALSTS